MLSPKDGSTVVEMSVAIGAGSPPNLLIHLGHSPKNLTNAVSLVSARIMFPLATTKANETKANENEASNKLNVHSVSSLGVYPQLKMFFSVKRSYEN